ncbi:MAG: 2-oxoglutarate dehydrogenase E2 component (dihydrolipoamide succinyltransferase) [Phycisphaerales bacterium]|jgi:2-oxoglutarate dehydrogenase E2 component (dihydrolipoamide succinyltransferase)
MPTPITMPEAGESVISGILASWVKSDGDHVERDETVAEVETDKITVELLAPAAGVLRQTVAEGDEIEIGQTVGEVDESANGAAPSVKADKPEPKQETQPGAASPAAESAPEPAAAPSAEGASESSGETRATPLARKLAAEHGTQLSAITGTGPGGRVREQDVLDHVSRSPAAQPAAPQKPAPSAAQPAKAPVASTGAAEREVTVERMSPLRKMVASRLVEAQQTAAMLTTFNECDMTAVMALRKQYKESFAQKYGIGLGFMSFFVKACVQALEKFPLVNSYIVEDGGKPAIQKHGYQDIAIAVSSPKGLVVPVIRNAEALSFAGIESAIKAYGAKAKDGKLTLEEMQGGTFTITNGGVFGSLLSTPILNPPQSGILGMHGIKKRAVEDPDNPGQIVLRPMMYLALSYDHRIVDGAEAVQFLVSIKDSIEDPQRLMLEL